MNGRRKKRGWRQQKRYSSERVAFYMALAAAVLVVVGTIVFAHIRRERAHGPSVSPVSSPGEPGIGNKDQEE